MDRCCMSAGGGGGGAARGQHNHTVVYRWVSLSDQWPPDLTVQEHDHGEVQAKDGCHQSSADPQLLLQHQTIRCFSPSIAGQVCSKDGAGQ